VTRGVGGAARAAAVSREVALSKAICEYKKAELLYKEYKRRHRQQLLKMTVLHELVANDKGVTAAAQERQRIIEHHEAIGTQLCPRRCAVSPCLVMFCLGGRGAAFHSAQQLKMVKLQASLAAHRDMPPAALASVAASTESKRPLRFSLEEMVAAAPPITAAALKKITAQITEVDEDDDELGAVGGTADLRDATRGMSGLSV